MKFPKRNRIYWADLNPTRGSEISKKRPCLVVSPDGMNRALETVVVCPLTSQLHSAWRSRIQIRCAGKPAEIAIDQIRSISKSRLTRKIDELAEGPARAVRRLISELYGDG